MKGFEIWWGGTKQTKQKNQTKKNILICLNNKRQLSKRPYHQEERNLLLFCSLFPGREWKQFFQVKKRKAAVWKQKTTKHILTTLQAVSCLSKPVKHTGRKMHMDTRTQKLKKKKKDWKASVCCENNILIRPDLKDDV